MSAMHLAKRSSFKAGEMVKAVSGAVKPLSDEAVATHHARRGEEAIRRIRDTCDAVISEIERRRAAGRKV
jgi:hypothetical protein